MSSTLKMSALSELSRKELISKINELIEEICLLKDENCLLKTELNEYINESKKQKRKSFSYRICNDLSEVLLQFLPLKDKLRLECVSKQFQRTVFRKQFSITLYSSLQSNNEMSEQTKDEVFERHYLKSIESLLKKCPNIQTMSIFVKNNTIFRSILPLITKYCDNLDEFKVSLDDATEPELNEEFRRLFGPKLKYISCGEDLDFNLFPNLYSVTETFIEIETIVGLNLENIKELNVDLLSQNQNLFPLLQKFHKIRRLTLCLNPDNEKSVLNAFKNSAVLQHLIELKIRTFEFGGHINQFFDSLKQSADKLPKLKSIAFTLVFDEDCTNLRQFLSPLKAFRKLKRLYLEIICLNLPNESKFSLKAFEELQNITHLSLKLFFSQIDEKLLTDIDIYLPKLQYLYISPFISPAVNTYKEGVTQIAESLSRLSGLQTIVFGHTLKYGPISQLMTAKITEKCRRIRKIKV